ncbi:MAG: UDP-2,3-diacylglucosamine diphosphatase [Bacteroidia bacterium]|nr:UDP-2,3-diacylglucosamine diphosphatase [Bacteroidia bacterium]
MYSKRNLDVLVISDIHLGTYGCHAKELLHYLKTVNPQTLVLNGDIIDIWNFSKSYFPSGHMDVLRQIMKMASHGTNIYYITGNHDELLRKYTDIQLGSFEVVDKLVLNLDGKKAWIFHGDVFDSSTKGYAKFLAKLGGKGYDLLILINRFINWVLKLFGKEKMSFSKKVKDSVKKAVAFVNDFETTAAELAIEKNYDYVICGHIHMPQIKEVKTDKGSVMYLNSGDWIENLTALEYDNGKWNIFHYDKNYLDLIYPKDTFKEEDVVSKILAS